MNLNKDKIFFTSDDHWDHANIIKFSDRPFGGVDEMNEALINEWNRVVPYDGVVFNLGDVSLGSPNRIVNYLNRLNGTIHLIKGNHEKTVMRKQEARDRFASIQDVLMIGVEDVDAVSSRKEGIQEIFMSHYAHRVWDKSHIGTFHLYGHSHNGLELYPWGKSMDVGVDSHAALFGTYAPFSYQEVKDILSKRDIKVIDHHTNEESEYKLYLKLKEKYGNR